MSKGKVRVVRGQASWRVASATVEAFVTRLGGHVAPVTFDRRRSKIRPYMISPWAEERLSPSAPAILRALRGDFFCMPFGDNATPYRGEEHPPHGETANSTWSFESLARKEKTTCLHLSLKTKVRKGRVDKFICLVDGHNVVYSRHVITGMSGPMNLGHHPTLKLPDREHSGMISTSGFRFGQVFPFGFESPEQGGYSILKSGAIFKSLKKVPRLDGKTADLSVYPARRGYEDLVLLVSDTTPPVAWTAVSFPKERYVWFSLKDPRVLRSTILWISNGGRHYAPWNGRNVNVLGLEEVTSYFHVGLAESVRKNPLSRKGVETACRLNAKKASVVNFIMGVARIPAGFDRVASIRVNEKKRAAVIRSKSGKTVEVPVDAGFLRGTDLPRA